MQMNMGSEGAWAVGGRWYPRLQHPPQLTASLQEFPTAKEESWPGQRSAVQTQGSFRSGCEIMLLSPLMKLAFTFTRKVLKYPKLESNT